MSYLIVAVMLVAAGALCLLRLESGASRPSEGGGRGSRSRATPAEILPRNEWHAISIDVNDNSCAAVRALEGKRFLSREAPSTPLPDCDAPVCDCRYVHHEDRRGGANERRRLQAKRDGAGEAVARGERRSLRDRRSTGL